MSVRGLLLGAVCILAFAGPVFADTNEERIRGWQRAIDRASEAGQTSRVHDLRLELARYAMTVGEYSEAARQYELILALRPGKKARVRYFVELGKARDALHEYSRAIGAFQDALHDDPDDYEANLWLARDYAKVDLNSKAMERYRRCIKLNPKDAKAHHELGALYQRTGYLNKAIASLEKAISLDPAPESYLALADCYVRQVDFKRATEVLQQAKTKVPRAEYDVRLGDLYIRAGEPKKGALAWEEALTVDPQRDDVRLKLALLYADQGNKKASERLMKTLASAYPDSPLVHFLNAMVLLRQGDRQGARREALRVQRMEATELVGHYNERLLALLNK
jgi:tetratricopeptide (TPR) repeat protein